MDECLVVAKSLAFGEATQHSVHPTGGSLRVFKQFSWLEVGSGKMALSGPAHQRVTHTVRRFESRIHENLA